VTRDSPVRKGGTHSTLPAPQTTPYDGSEAAAPETRGQTVLLVRRSNPGLGPYDVSLSSTSPPPMATMCIVQVPTSGA
jgi:hypothetical protein